MHFLRGFMAVSTVKQLKMEFDDLCGIGMSAPEDPVFGKTILEQMLAVQDKILKTISNATSPTPSLRQVMGAPLLQRSVSILTNAVAQLFLGDDPEELAAPQPSVEALKSDMRDKLSIISQMANKPPPVVETEPANPLSVGFRNLSANCWANSLLQLLLVSPSLQNAYTAVAMKYLQDKDGTNQDHGESLHLALVAYHIAFADGRPVEANVTQNVRLAFHHFFGQSGEIFSASPDVHEDACEAIQVVMSRYEEILKEAKQFPPAELYRPMETTRIYRPVGEPRDPDPVKLLQKDGYSKLEDLTSSQTNADYQICLDLQNRGHLTFSALLLEHFRNTCVQGHDPSVYLRPDGKIQDFELIGERRKFTQTPDEFLLTIKRFGMRQGTGYKVLSQINIERTVVLPAIATAAGSPIAYALDGFIVHGGGYGVGHYVAYKKIDGQWVECNDSRVRFVTTDEIDRILHGLHANGPKYTSYIHHYSRTDEPVQEPVVDQEAIARAKEHCEKVIAHLMSGSSLEDLPIKALETLRHIVWIYGGAVTYPNFGQIVLQSQPGILKEITLPFLMGGGLNLIEQMIAVEKCKLAILSADPLQAEKLQYGYERDQLQAFHDLLTTPGLSNAQLFEAFRRLDVRVDLKEKLYWYIWIDHGMKEITDYGRNKFKENPRCILEIRNGRLTEPPICKPNADILEQLIALLDRQSH
jgi:hypothetical protein